MYEFKLNPPLLKVDTKYEITIKNFPTQMAAAKFALEIQEQKRIKDEDIFISGYFPQSLIEERKNDAF